MPAQAGCCGRGILPSLIASEWATPKEFADETPTDHSFDNMKNKPAITTPEAQGLVDAGEADPAAQVATDPFVNKRVGQDLRARLIAGK